MKQLYDKYHAEGFNLVGFISNQFGGQAPLSDAEERAFAHKKFKLDFPVFDKVMVLDKSTPMWSGPTSISPVYRFLKDQTPPAADGSTEIPWNYTKFLVRLRKENDFVLSPNLCAPRRLVVTACRSGGTRPRTLSTRAWSVTSSRRWLASPCRVANEVGIRRIAGS